MSSRLECRKCGIEIEPDITNPYDRCNGCIEQMEEERGGEKMNVKEVVAKYPALKAGGGRSSFVFTEQDYKDAVAEDLI